MAVLVSIIAVSAMAAATGAATAAGYSLYKYIKNRGQRRRRKRPKDQESELDFGQELEVYKIVEIRIPPPVAPKPQRIRNKDNTTTEAKIVTRQPNSVGVEEDRSEDDDETDRGTVRPAPDPGLIARLCPNAVRVLPGPPPMLPHRLKAAVARNTSSCKNGGQGTVKLLEDPGAGDAENV